MFGLPVLDRLTALLPKGAAAGDVKIPAAADPNRYVKEGYVQPAYIKGE